MATANDFGASSCHREELEQRMSLIRWGAQKRYKFKSVLALEFTNLMGLWLGGPALNVDVSVCACV